MKRTTLFVSILLLATASFAQEQTKYESSKHHFSFMLPEGWEVIPVDSLSKKERNDIKQIYPASTSLVLCQEFGANYFSTPYILVQFGSMEEKSEINVERIWQSDINIRRLLKDQEDVIVRLQKAEAFLPKSWEGAKRVDAKVHYDKNKHASFEMVQLYKEGVGNIFRATVRLFGSHRVVSFRFYVDSVNKDEFLNLVNNVVDSLRYDEGYEFGGGKGVAPGLTRKLFGGSIWSWIWPIIAISIVIWLLNRWAAS